ncbi:MAG: nucleoside recognition domain-containing protein [Bacilli bacterium]|nr:nucleoside recognition domain-containing protein [Bacilli bacterium]
MNKIIEFFQKFMIPTIISLGEMLLKIIIIITIIMVVIEVLKALHVLEWLNKRLYFFTRFLGISPQASFPLLIGVTIGITYGAGAILLSYNNKEMSKKDVILVSIFLLLCHAIFEDTLLFTSLGALGWIVVPIKVMIATVVTYIARRIIEKKHLLETSPIEVTL